MNQSESEAYERGKLEGAVISASLSAARAHTRIDEHGVRVTALEKVMYSAIGVVLFIQLMPALKALSGGF